MDKIDLKNYIGEIFMKYNDEDRFGFTIPFKFINFNILSFQDLIGLCDAYRLILTYCPNDEYIMLEYLCSNYYEKYCDNKKKKHNI